MTHSVIDRSGNQMHDRDVLYSVERRIRPDYFQSRRMSVGVVCVGDSIAGWNNCGEPKNWPFPTYPQFLQELFITEGSPITVANCGIAGDLSSRASEHAARYLSLFRNASYFIINYGTNDLGGDDSKEDASRIIIANLDVAVDFVRNAGKTAVLFNVPHVNEAHFPDRVVDETKAKREYHNARLDEFCAEKDLTLVDICSKLRTEHFGDNLHPNEAGARVIAGEVFSKLFD